MPIFSRTVYNRQILRDVGLEEITLQGGLDRTFFATFPNPADRNFLLHAVEIGALPAEKTANDQVIVTDTEITVQIEWLSQEHCQAWADMRKNVIHPFVISSEMVVS